MTGEQIFGLILCLGICWGCGAVFLGIGIWAVKRKTPMHFWSGTDVDAKSVSDIPAYNRENGRMWKLFSVPFWLAGFFGILGIWKSWISTLSYVLIMLTCTVGIGWLVWRYNQICKKYMVS